ncbi:MAG: hypothetical protein B7Y88_13810 [Sphingomonadales bacterium 32-64-17]|nr:MAG: hypothetical protein B7Y88_13810 [Sphingomonadales bacterium 32-64-17]
MWQYLAALVLVAAPGQDDAFPDAGPDANASFSGIDWPVPGHLDDVDQWQGCVVTAARGLALTFDDPADLIAEAAFAECSKFDAIVFSRVRGDGDEYSETLDFIGYLRANTKARAIAAVMFERRNHEAE